MQVQPSISESVFPISDSVRSARVRDWMGVCVYVCTRAQHGRFKAVRWETIELVEPSTCAVTPLPHLFSTASTGVVLIEQMFFLHTINTTCRVLSYYISCWDIKQIQKLLALLFSQLHFPGRRQLFNWLQFCVLITVTMPELQIKPMTS